MATKEDYLHGRVRARLDWNLIDATWAHPRAPHTSHTINFCNRAFDLYYDAYWNAYTTADHPQQLAMLRELEDAATEGTGGGVSDLEEAFEHLADNGGHWRDNDTARYSAGRGKAFYAGDAGPLGGTTVVAPAAIVNFMNAVDDKMGALAQIIEEYRTQARRLLQFERSNRWEDVGTLLGLIQSVAERAQPLLWFAPTAQWAAGRTASFANVLSNIHSYLTSYDRARRAGFPQGASVAYVALQTAVGFVPVLGSFYGQIIAEIPGLVGNWREFMQEYHRQRLHPESSRR